MISLWRTVRVRTTFLWNFRPSVSSVDSDTDLSRDVSDASRQHEEGHQHVHTPLSCVLFFWEAAANVSEEAGSPFVVLNAKQELGHVGRDVEADWSRDDETFCLLKQNFDLLQRH